MTPRHWRIGARYWFRGQLPTGERCTVWTCTQRAARQLRANWRRAGVRLLTRGTRRRPAAQ